MEGYKKTQKITKSDGGNKSKYMKYYNNINGLNSFQKVNIYKYNSKLNCILFMNSTFKI